MSQKRVDNFLIIFLFACLYSSVIEAQSLLDKTYSLRIKKGSSVELFDELEDASGITFSYSNKLCLKSNLTLSEKTNSVKGFIAEILSGCDYNIVEKSNKIIITPSESDKIKNFVISGFVKNESTAEYLIGSSVYDALRMQGSSSNNFGYYSLTLPQGDIILNCSYVGYGTVQHRFYLKKDTIINFNLKKNALIREVPVLSFSSEESINSSCTSSITV